MPIGLKKRKNGKRFIDCDDYSSIYLLIGEFIGLSLKPVYAPGHIFLMCRLDDNTCFYWEPTITAERDMVFYKEWLNIAEDSVYPKELNEIEFEAIHFCNLGVAWYEKGDYCKAIEFYEKAIQLSPFYPEAHNNLGVAYAKQGKYARALECYRYATTINPNYATSYLNMGIAFYKLGYFRKAIEYYEKTIEVDPKNEKALTYMYAALVKMEKQGKALEVVETIDNLKTKNLRLQE